MHAAPLLDPRYVRFQQGVVAVVLLAGYVFRTDWVIPLTAAALGIGIVRPSANVLAHVWDTLVAGRLDPPRTLASPDEVRFATLFVVALLAIATALLAVGLGGLAWLLAVVLAGSEAVGAVAAIPVGRALYELLRRRGR